ncbi:MAG: hypothetical protein RL380_439, partial [Verrucomicrobiota bacterium]
LTLLLALALVAVGCTTKSTARANQRAAFYAGQAQALSDQLASQKPQRAPGNTVAIVGPVKVSALAWTPGLTLAQTIFAAEYIPAGEPSQILITRNGSQFPVSPEQLLNGGDFPIELGDVIELRP